MDVEILLNNSQVLKTVVDEVHTIFQILRTLKMADFNVKVRYFDEELDDLTCWIEIQDAQTFVKEDHYEATVDFSDCWVVVSIDL